MNSKQEIATKRLKLKHCKLRPRTLKRVDRNGKRNARKKTREIKRLEDEAVVKDELIEAERKLRKQEAEAHVEEFESLKKKWEMLQQRSQEKKTTKSLTDTIRQFLS